MVNPWVDTIIWWAVFFVIMVLAVRVFDWLTPFKLSEEIKEANPALGVVLGGMLIGMGIIIYNAMLQSTAMLTAILYSLMGLALMLVSYYLYDLVTPGNTNKEIDNHNLLTGYKMAGLFIAVALVVSGALS